ncbi:MAG: hypothetical protein RL444_1004 [Verrucomicrobiota bacterium]
MRHLGVFHEESVQGFTGARLGISADTYDGADAKRLHHHAQQLVALLVHRRHDFRRQLLRDDVTTLLGILQEEQRAVIVDQVIGEEGLGLAEAFLEEPPETATADLGPMAGEAGHFLARMLLVRASDRHLQPHPVSDGGDLPERHAGLGHAEGSRVHAQEEHLLGTRSRIAT